MTSAQLSSPWDITQRSRAAFVSGHEQHIFLPDLPKTGPDDALALSSLVAGIYAGLSIHWSERQYPDTWLTVEISFPHLFTVACAFVKWAATLKNNEVLIVRRNRSMKKTFVWLTLCLAMCNLAASDPREQEYERYLKIHQYVESTIDHQYLVMKKRIWSHRAERWHCSSKTDLFLGLRAFNIWRWIHWCVQLARGSKHKVWQL